MKIRQSFVSNSSSASFVIRWKVLGEEDIPVDEAIDSIMEYDSEKIIKEAKEVTKRIARNLYESCFWTSMMNCPGDFGDVAHDLLFSLFMRQNHYCEVGGGMSCEILDTKINED